MTFRAVVRLALQIALPIVAALVVVPFVKPGGSLWPWAPSTVDLDVYQYIGNVLLDGGDIITARTPPPDNLAFIYPPFAALLCIPLVVVPLTLLQIVWTAANALLVGLVPFRIGLRGWVLSLATTGCVLLVEPIRETIGFGQINIMLMALVVIDLLPGPRLLTGRRLLPEGVLTGLAAAIKVTAGLFAVHQMFARRWRTAIVMTVTAGAITLVTAILMPGPTLGFASALLEGDTRTGPAHFLFNQSILSAVLRWTREAPGAHLAGLAISAVVAVAGAFAAGRWQRRGEPLLAISLCGTATLLASPLSWTHHFVWVVPLGMAVLLGRELPASIRLTGGAFAVWMAVGSYKFMPWGSGTELRYGVGENVMAALGPALGVVLIVVAVFASRDSPPYDDRVRAGEERGRNDRSEAA